MEKFWFTLLLLLLSLGVPAQNKKKSKSVKKLTKQYVQYVNNQDKGKKQLAKKKSNDPASVTREKDSLAIERPQDPMQAAYDEFVRQAQTQYENFRDKANQEYAEFMKNAWQEFKAKPAIKLPVEKDVPPVVIKEEDRDKTIINKPLPVEEEIVTLPVPEPQPVPIGPIREQDIAEESSVSFALYGTNMSARFCDDERFVLPECSEKAVSDAWKRLSGNVYNNTIRDCLELRITKRLSDWAYLKMLDNFSKACLGNGNEAVLLMAYIYCQTGYRMRLGILNKQLVMLYATDHVVFSHPYYVLDSETYYLYNCDAMSLKICNIAFPKEKSLSLFIPQAQLFDYAPSEERSLKSERYSDMEIKSVVNKNLICFCEDYPKSSVGDNFMTRWAMLANMPMDEKAKENLYPQLRKVLKGLSEKDATERLLNWVQTSLVYEYDDKVWGDDRAFFAEESLYYPYADCEDRSILLSRLVRDLLGLKTILVYYPGHLAMAVGFNEDVKGDYIMLNDRKYVVCDPTYVGASVGMTMTGMDNQAAKVISLE